MNSCQPKLKKSSSPSDSHPSLRPSDFRRRLHLFSASDPHDCLFLIPKEYIQMSKEIPRNFWENICPLHSCKLFLQTMWESPFRIFCGRALIRLGHSQSVARVTYQMILLDSPLTQLRSGSSKRNPQVVTNTEHQSSASIFTTCMS